MCQSTPTTTVHPVLDGCLTPPADVKAINFSPGPCNLPEQVEDEIKATFDAPRASSMYLSHRSPEFVKILQDARKYTKEALCVPDNYEILFMHGGGHGQFAAVPLNLMSSPEDKATYLVNGTWSKRAAAEASKYGKPVVISSENEDGTFTSNPDAAKYDPDSKYIYMCSNETVNGIEAYRLPKLGPDSPPLVVDGSSDLTTKPIEWEESNIGVIYACASKNIGHPGLTLVIIRNDMYGKQQNICPGVLCYEDNIKADNAWNTSCTFNIEVTAIMMKWICQEGAMPEMEKRSIIKSSMIYDVIDNSNGFYSTPQEKSIRSRMNVPFDVAGGDVEITNEFLIKAWEQGIIGLRTKTPFGVGKYLRASLYNGISIQQTEKLKEYMIEFMESKK